MEFPLALFEKINVDLEIYVLSFSINSPIRAHILQIFIHSTSPPPPQLIISCPSRTP
jgi:hypothetical protein